MLIVTDVPGLERAPDHRAACVLVDPDDAALSEAVAGVIAEPHLLQLSLDGRRPLVHVDDERCFVLTYVADGGNGVHRTLLVTRGTLLVVVGDAKVRELVRAAVGGADSAAHGMAKALGALAREAEDQMFRVSGTDVDADLDAGADRLISGDLRRQVRRRRAGLFEWRQLYALQARLLDDDEPLSEALGRENRRWLRPAQGSFRYAADVADRLYAALGDVLAQQDALSSQRLTLVSTVFLPLTVTTGFFGMNFGWLTDTIGSLTSFVVFGVVVPALSVLASLALVRRYGV